MPRSLTDNEFGTFIQDDFKVTGRLTLDFGIRSGSLRTSRL